MKTLFFLFIALLSSCAVTHETFRFTSMSTCGKTNGRWGYWSTIYQTDNPTNIHIQGNVINVDNAEQDVFRLEKVVRRNAA
jgi:hypothetical protein